MIGEQRERRASAQKARTTVCFGLSIHAVPHFLRSLPLSECLEQVRGACVVRAWCVRGACVVPAWAVGVQLSSG